VVYAGDVNLRNCHHDSEPLHCRRLPDTLQDSKIMIIAFQRVESKPRNYREALAVNRYEKL